jgi:SAM-dependent methyltransferase
MVATRLAVLSQLLLLCLLAVARAIPEGLTFKPKPHRFKEWDDGHADMEESSTCTASGEGTEGCQQTAKPNLDVQDRIDGVRDYYNSDRAIKLISAGGPLPKRTFHSPVSVFGTLSEGDYMMLLAGLRGRKKPFKVLKAPGQDRKTVLDYGCGLGTFARRLASTGCCNVCCVNIAEKQVEEARKLAPKNDVEYAAFDGYTFPYSDGFFDVVFFSGVVQFSHPEPVRDRQRVQPGFQAERQACGPRLDGGPRLE